jgi:protein phosphatase
VSGANAKARRLRIRGRSLVLLIGPSGSGKSTFAHRHFHPMQIVSSDSCRALVCDDESDQYATPAAFQLLHFILAKRMDFGRLCVVDATNVETSARSGLLSLARDNAYPTTGIVFDVSLEVAMANNRRRERQVSEEVIARHIRELRESRLRLSREGFAHLHVFKSVQDVDLARVTLE